MCAVVLTIFLYQVPNRQEKRVEQKKKKKPEMNTNLLGFYRFQCFRQPLHYLEDPFRMAAIRLELLDMKFFFFTGAKCDYLRTMTLKAAGNVSFEIVGRQEINDEASGIFFFLTKNRRYYTETTVYI